MFCPQCAAPLVDGMDHCQKCGFYLELPQRSEHDSGMRMLLPVGRSVWAILAGYLGLLSPVLIPAPFALGCGIMAVIDIRKHPQRRGMGRAVFGIVMGALGTRTASARVSDSHDQGEIADCF